MVTIRDRVLDALQGFPETRNDDRLLYLKVLEAMKLITPAYTEIRQLGYRRLDHYIINFDDIEKLPSLEAVRRRRQEIQNDEHKFIPTDPAVLKKRMFYQLCPHEILVNEGLVPDEVIKAVCDRCEKHGTEKCNLVSSVAGLRA